MKATVFGDSELNKGNVMSFEEFTVEGYKELIRKAMRGRVFEPFGTTEEQAHVLWRHDVDMSVHRAARLAEVEAGFNVRATYFIQFTSEFYNVFENTIRQKIDEILSHGHWIGLHFDFSMVKPDDTREVVFEKMEFEKSILEKLFGTKVKCMSFHNPEMNNALSYDDDEICGMVNTYGRSIKEKYVYGSDSNGLWRHTPIGELADNTDNKYLHLLTHPVWWQEEPMAPRSKIDRSAKGRYDFVMNNYDQLLLNMGRPNIR